MLNNLSVKKAILYTMVGKYSTIIMQTVFSMILSRVLTPTEFGTVAVVSIFITFFSILSDLGLGAGVIQNKKMTNEDVNNIFSVSVYLGIGLMLIFVVLSYPIATIYNDKVYYKLCPILATSVLFNSFNMIPNAVMLKEKNFLSIAKRTFISCIVSYAVSIGLALQGWGVYALCFSQVMSSLMIFLWNEGSVKLKFHFKADIKPIKMIWGYSFYQFTSQTINFFCRSLDSFLVGILFSKADLAYYNKSYSLMMLPISNIPGVINPVLHPILSEYQDNRFEIYKRYQKMVRILVILGSLISVLCFTFGDQIIYIMFGDQWDEAVLPFRILSLSLIPQFLTNTIGTIYQSVGETKKLFHSVIITTTLIILSIVMGAMMGSIVTVSIMVSMAYVMSFLITFYLLFQNVFGYSFETFLKPMKSDFMIFVVVIAIVSLMPVFNDIWIDTSVKFAVYITYCLLYLILGKRYFQIISMLKSK